MRQFVRTRALTSVMAAIAIACAADQAVAADQPKRKVLQKVTDADKKAAAQRAAETGLVPGVAGLAAPTAVGVTAVGVPPAGIEGPGGVPHYFGPYANWANSPLPSFGILSVAVDTGGSGYIAPLVAITDVYGTGTATATATVDATGAITGITVDPGSAGFHVPFVTITDDPSLCGGALQPACGTGATATAKLDTANPAGGMLKFVDGLPGLGPTAKNNLGQYIPVAVPEDRTYSGQLADYYEIAVVEFYEKMHSNLPATKTRGYVQLSTPALVAANLSKQVPLLQACAPPPMTATCPPVLMPDGTPAIAVDDPHFLGPVLVAKGRAHGVAGPAGEPKPVRIKFYNLLPAGVSGELFLPVDETVAGSGLGPSLPGTAGDKFTQNRATVHLHGNNTVWISDGNTHQWITPADETTPYPKGVSVRNVPDMLDATGAPECDVAPAGKNSSGCMTFFYTNAQSARLQFYHDHASGITRLNVYAGEAGGYVITDAVEQDLIQGSNVSGVNVNCVDKNADGDAVDAGECAQVLPGLGIPLLIQDRTWVDANTVFAQDPTWNWGTGPRGPDGKITAAVTGDLWYPHVYMSVQNPWDLGGVNGFGRWHYGPWFNPPVPECVNGGPVGCIELGAVPNEYYDPLNAPWEPPMRPGVPNPSIPGESFMDTPIVNGTAYPYMEVEPKAYRFRVLSGANDRAFNLQLYVAADKASFTPGTGPADPPSANVLCDGSIDPLTGLPVPVDRCTEVKMISVNGQPNQFSDSPSGIPDPMTKGPPWILIGTEGGFTPAPLVIEQQPVGWNFDPATFNFGVVNQHALFLGSAERADVIVDFSAYAGKTLILYNDAPAPVPAGAAPYDYFTGSGHQVDAGGAPNTYPGYGPNTRTVMQIRVAAAATTPTPDVTLPNLQAAWAKTATKRGVFEVTQDPIIIPQAAYNSAYNQSFPTTAEEQFAQIADKSKTFRPIDETGTQAAAPITMAIQMKAMHDEMGGVYDTMFGRMSGMLGLSNPNSAVNLLLPYGYSSPPTDVVKGSLEASPIGVMPDGTQLWRIFHNGVDTHTIHTHLFHAQLINRTGQDGLQLGVDPIDLGWKDTFRVNPLEVTWLALRPTIPMQSQLPFEVPDSVRLIDPSLPEAATLIPPPPAGWFDPQGNAIPEILNHYVNFGWEYVWHCHILSHEEMDMMHSLVFAVPPKAPVLLDPPQVIGNANNPTVVLSWMDNSLKEVQYTIERAANASFSVGLTSFNYANPDPTTTGQVWFEDATVEPNSIYHYRVKAIGAPVGDFFTAGFPTMSADSVSNAIQVTVGVDPGTPAAPSNLVATLQSGPRVTLTWTDNADSETGFSLERCSGTPCTFVQIAAPARRNNTGTVSYTDATVAFGNVYQYRVIAVNGSGLSAPSNVVIVDVPAIPPAPTSLTVSAAPAGGKNYTATLSWTTTLAPTSYTIQRANNLSFTTGLATFTVTGDLTTLVQTIKANTSYYYRIRANNAVGGFSAWRNALPFPIRTGP